MGCGHSKPLVKDPTVDEGEIDGNNLDGAVDGGAADGASFGRSSKPSSKRGSDRAVDNPPSKSPSGLLPSMFSKSKRKDGKQDGAAEEGEVLGGGVGSAGEDGVGPHSIPGRSVKSQTTPPSATLAANPDMALDPPAPPSAGTNPAEEPAAPVGSKLIRSKGKIEVMGFEVANVIVRAINLRQSLLERDIEDLRAEVLASEGIRMLVSDDFYHVWCMAAEDKRGELRSVARDVARLGRQCLDAKYHSLPQDFDALGTMDGPKGQMTAAEAEAQLRVLEGQAQVTAELYHELANLESIQQALDRRVREGVDTAMSRELIAQMRAELKSQEKIVKAMKKKGLWSKQMDEVVEKLVEVVIFLHDQIVDVFGADVVKVGRLMSGTPPTTSDLRKLGVNGMALQYSNIVNMIDTMVMRPQSVDQQRESLFSTLPTSICGRLKRTLLQSRDIEQESTESIRQKMEAVLDWLVTMAENSIRYGLDSRVQGHTDLTLLQTLHHVDELKMERLVLLLLVGLQHLVSRAAEHQWSPVPRAALLAPVYAPGSPRDSHLTQDSFANSNGAAAAAAAAAAGDGGDGAAGEGAALETANGVVVVVGGDDAELKAAGAGDAAAPWAFPAAAADTEKDKPPHRRDPSADVFIVEGEGEEGPSAAAAATKLEAAEAAAAEAAASVSLSPISLALTKRSISESVPTVDDWETLPRQVGIKVKDGAAAAGAGAEAGSDGGNSRPHSSGGSAAAAESAAGAASAAGGLEGGVGGEETPAAATAAAAAANGAGTVGPDPILWRQLRALSVSESPLDPVPEAAGQSDGEGEVGDNEGEGEDEDEAHADEKMDQVAPLAPLLLSKSLAGAKSVGVSEISSPSVVALRALSLGGLSTGRKSLENALRASSSGSAATSVGSDRTPASGSALAGLSGEQLLAAMTMSQGFGPGARGPASEEMLEAMRELTMGRSRSHTFAMAPRTAEMNNPRFFTKSLSRMQLSQRMEAEEQSGSIYVPPQRFLPMTPSTLDVDRICDVTPNLELSDIPRPGSASVGGSSGRTSMSRLV